MSRILYLDCSSGASGDMFLGALIDLGVPLDDVRAALGTLVPPGTDVRTARVVRGGIAALSFTVIEPEAGQTDRHEHAEPHRHGDADVHHHDDAHTHGHAHPHGHTPGRPHAHDHGHQHSEGGTRTAPDAHHHRPLAEIIASIERSALPPAARARAIALYERIGQAEADVHGIPVDRVHLHEVGAVDSVVDIVGAAYALHCLNVDRIVASPLNLGGGRVRTAHGLLPVPAPATLRLIEGAPVFSDGTPHELLTPTGALLVTGYASAWGPMPPMRVLRAGYGAGGRDLPDRPNVLRAVLGEEDARAHADRVVVIETNIDDMNPQVFGSVMERLFAAGALDVFFTPAQMKKNRPSTLVTVIASPGTQRILTDVLFRETTTIGVRFHEAARECLPREIVTVPTPFGAVRLKLARHEGRVKVTPEFDDCARLAAASDVPVRDVQAAALRAFDHQDAVGRPADSTAQETSRE